MFMISKLTVVCDLVSCLQSFLKNWRCTQPSGESNFLQLGFFRTILELKKITVKLKTQNKTIFNNKKIAIQINIYFL